MLAVPSPRPRYFATDLLEVYLVADAFQAAPHRKIMESLLAPAQKNYRNARHCAAFFDGNVVVAEGGWSSARNDRPSPDVVRSPDPPEIGALIRCAIAHLRGPRIAHRGQIHYAGTPVESPAFSTRAGPVLNFPIRAFVLQPTPSPEISSAG